LGQFRDVKILITLRGLRGMSYGLFNTALGLYLNDIGYGLLQVGLLVTIASLSSAALILVSGILADRLESRKFFLTLACTLMVGLGIIYAATTSFPMLVFGSALGGAGSAGGGAPGGGPFGPAQQALLAAKVEDKRRHTTFSINALAGTLLFSLGAASAGLPEALSSSIAGKASLYRISFGGFAVVGLLMTFLCLLVQEEPHPRIEARSKQSTKLIAKFLAAATLNGFGLGFIPLPLLTLWFRVAFHASDALISAMVGASNLFSAFSYAFAPAMARRLGTVRMVVSTRFVGVALLATLPLLPSFSVASIVYVIRGIFTSVGLPIRQSYMMGVVGNEDRATAVGVSSGLGWGFPYAVTPVVSGYMMEEVSLSLPIYISVLLQMANSAVYYGFFHHLRPPEELANGQS
jgi:MFS family permease